MSIKRSVVLGILDKIGAPHTTKISAERAVKKLQRFLPKTGIPDTLNSDETQLLVDLELLDTQDAEESPTSAVKETPKGKKAKPKSSDDKPSSGSTSDKEKGKRPNWMEIGAKAVLHSRNLKEAGKLAIKNYLAAGGRESPFSKQNGYRYATRAAKALQAANVLSLDSDGTITILEK